MTPPNDTYFARLLDPRVRGYLVTVGASLAVVFVALSQRGQPTAALAPVVLALPGLLLRWTAMPGVVLAAVCYLLVFPTGSPFDGYGSGFADVRTSYFEGTDLVFVPAVLCYLAAQYRLYAFTIRAVPDDRPKHLRSAADPVHRRPVESVPPTELHWLFAAIGAAVLGGQLLWLVLTKYDIAPIDFPPVRFSPRGVSAVGSRFVLLVAVVATVGIGAGLVFWYWRLSGMNADEARLTLIDTGWAEVRREAARQETWRAWGRPGGGGGGGVSIRAWLGGIIPVVTAVTLAAVGIVLVLWMLFVVFSSS
jgi:hypothetical protein